MIHCTLKKCKFILTNKKLPDMVGVLPPLRTIIRVCLPKHLVEPHSVQEIVDHRKPAPTTVNNPFSFEMSPNCIPSSQSRTEKYT